MRLILFDIDGTLLLTNGAGTLAMNRAFIELYGLKEVRNVRPDGKTDLLIIRETLQLNRLPHMPDGRLEEFLSSYERHFAQTMLDSGMRVFHGAVRLARLLADDPRYRVGLATGNIESCAWGKLEQAGIRELFSFGGFGSDAEDRSDLIQAAINRGAEGDPEGVESTVVIGDTPRDIQHGHSVGARTIAVATGSYSLRKLQSARPGLAVESLQPSKELLAFIRRL